jgi:ATP-dependent protease ClpP protease subunit
MAGDSISMPEDAYIMIHNTHSIAYGDSKEFIKTALELEQFDGTISNIYAKKTGESVEKLRELMDAETWMDGNAAKAMGFVDEVTNAKKVAACFKFDKFRNTPQALQQNTSSMLNLYQDEVNLIRRRF